MLQEEQAELLGAISGEGPDMGLSYVGMEPPQSHNHMTSAELDPARTSSTDQLSHLGAALRLTVASCLCIAKGGAYIMLSFPGILL